MSSPATPTQRRLWALAHLRPGDPFYNVPFSVRLDGPLDREALARALTEVVRRHPALRTTLQQVDGDLVRVVAPPAPITLAPGPVDVDAFAREPFDLSRGPLFRARLVRDGDQAHRLLVNVHHVVFDGASHDLFLDELTALYDAFTRGEASPLPALPPHVPQPTDSLDHWVRRLEGIPPVIPLPLKGPRPVTGDYRTARATRLIPPEVVAPLRLVARERRASMFMLLKAACAVLLHQHGASDVVLGIPTSGRDTVASARHIGYLVKTVVTRTRFTGDPTFTEVLAHVRNDVLDAQEHADLPFEDVAQALGIPRETGHDPIYQVLFGYETASRARRGGGVRFTPSYLSLNTAKADLDVLLSEAEHGLAAHFDYRVDLFEEHTVHRMLSRLETVLRRIGRDPDAPVSRLVRPDEAESAQLRSWEETDLPRGVEPHRLVEEQVDRSPDAVAVEARGRVWTYAEVEALANRVARHTAASRVAVCLPLSGEFVAAVLGVFKAGGTCVPLDPDLPPYLLRTMAQDAGAALVLSDAHSGGVFEDLPVTLVSSLDGPDDRVGGAAGAAFVAHTSESRGVEFDTRVLGDLLEWARRDLPPVACAAPIGSLSSGTALFEVFAALTAGGRVTDDVKAATLVCATPALLGRLHAVAPVVLSTGEVLHPSLVRSLHDAGAEAVHNVYGVAGVFAVGGRVSPDEPVTIGRPLRAVVVRVLDERSQPVPPGVVGALHLDGVATGDRARHTADGRLELVGDAVVVEAVVLDHPAVTQACLLPDGVVAVVSTASPPDVEAHLRAHLPGYLVPSRVVVVPDLPLRPDGTVDRHALARSAAKAAPARARHVPPATEAERRVAEVWSALLGRTVDVDRNFFEAGGNSLLIVRLRDELNTAFGLDLAVAELFRRPTVRAMSELVGGGAAQPATTDARDRAQARRAALARRERR